MIFKLRPYQEELKKSIRELFTDGHRRVILCSPTGSGKTVTFADIAREAVRMGSNVMIAVDRRELLEQAKEKLISYRLSPSVISAGRSVRHGQRCYVATVQTLVRRVFPDIDLLIIDEAHKQIFDKLLREGYYDNVFVIGATATPKRSGKMRQLSSMYSKIVKATTIQDLIVKKYLSPAITYGAKVDTSKIKITRGDFDAKELYSAFDKRVLYAGVVEKYQKFANGTKALCFCINIEHSKKVCHAFNSSGIPAVHLDGKTPSAEREKILKAFAKGMFKVLVNVEVLTTGYDEWSIDTVIVNLATKSLPKWLQMCGRGSRVPPEGVKSHKDHFNIIDMGGNVFEHGFWEHSREYSLTHKTKDTLGVAPVKECPETELDINKKPGCGAIVPIQAAQCKYCGYVFPPPKKATPQEAEFIQLENYELLPAELIGKSWGSMNIEELEKVRTIKGYGHGWIVRQILLSKHLQLIDYANFKGYKHPKAWVSRMEEMYVVKN